MEYSFKSRTDFEDRVKTIIAYELEVDKKTITPQSNFSRNFYADFLSMVYLVMEFEKEFNISIPDEQIEKIKTVSEAHECIRKNGTQRFFYKEDNQQSAIFLV